MIQKFGIDNAGNMLIIDQCNPMAKKHPGFAEFKVQLNYIILGKCYLVESGSQACLFCFLHKNIFFFLDINLTVSYENCFSLIFKSTFVLKVNEK